MGVYKALVIQDNKLVGACLYGDTGDGARYFQLIREGRHDIHEMRDHLMFGENHLGDAGHAGQNKAAAMPDDAGCAAATASKGTIVKAIQRTA